MRTGLTRIARLSRLCRSRLALAAAGDEGSSPVEFVLVGALLTVLTLGVLQLGLAIYVRNVVHDAAVEGAYYAALADTSLSDGADRTADIVSRAVGDGYAADIEVRDTIALGHAAIEVRVTATLPLVGFLGAARSMEVVAHAPAESFE